jgi:LmbE family N-acetylglucosaminyl deacetylase
MRNLLRELAPCPLPLPLDLSVPRRVLVFAPHPDDETIGCGGTIALLRDRGCAVTVVFVTDGAGGDPEGHQGGQIVSVRQREATLAAASLGDPQLIFWAEPDGRTFDSWALRQRIAALVRAEKPDWIFLPSLLDYHRDHVAVARAVLRAVRRTRVSSRCFLYEIWAPVLASHNVDISSVAARKEAALGAYPSQLAYFDHRKASLALGTLRALFASRQGTTLTECFLEASGGFWLGMPGRLWRLRRALERLLTSGR